MLRAHAGLCGWQYFGSMVGFIFRAVETEDTPNVHSYGFSLSAGYALLNLGEIKALMSYRPLNASAGSLDHADGQQVYSGLELGLTSLEGLYLGLRYGLSQFSLPKTGDFDVSGKWQGFTAGVVLLVVGK